MAYSFVTTCKNPKCGKKFDVSESPMGVPGGKDREEYYCPYCQTENGYIMTDGFVHTRKINEDNNS